MQQTVFGHATRCMFFLFLVMLAVPMWTESSSAASSKLCLRNTGDAPIQVAILYKGSWGGWVAEGWWNQDPQGLSGGCTPVPSGGSSLPFFYVAVYQQGADGKWGSVGYDVSRVQWEEDGLDTTGGTFRLLPRPTIESSQGTSVWGLEQDLAGVKVILCAPQGGTKQIANLENQESCPDNEILVLFGTKLYAPTDGGFLADNVYEIYFRSDKTSPTFSPAQLAGIAPPPAQSPKPEPKTPPAAPDKQFDELMKLLEAEAAKGNVEVQMKLAQLHMSGELGVKSPDKAAQFYLMAASNGEASAYYEYAVLVLDGHVKANDTVARAMLQIAANKGSIRAAERLKAMPN